MPNFSFAHPVLGNGDDVLTGAIASELRFSTSAESVELDFSGLTTGNPTIDSALAEGSARWVLRVQCARTYFRRIWLERGPTAHLRIAGPELEGEVHVEARICSTQWLTWQPAGAHPDYGEQEFQLDAGEVLALGPTWRFTVDKEFDPLKAPMASWMRVEEGDHDEGPFVVEFGDDVVKIRLSKQDWPHYAGVRDRASPVLHSCLVLPVLMQALIELQQDDGVLWKGRLRAVLDKAGWNPEPPLQTAQLLLGGPFGRSLRELNVKLDGAEA